MHNSELKLNIEEFCGSGAIVWFYHNYTFLHIRIFK